MQNLDPKAFWLFLAPNFIAIIIFSVVITFSIIAVIFQYSTSSTFDGIFFLRTTGILIAFIVFAVGWSYLFYKSYHYEVTDGGLKIEKGVLWKNYSTIPYERIQNINIDRGPVARILGLSVLKIQTAGASGVAAVEGNIPGIRKEHAENVRNDIIARAKGGSTPTAPTQQAPQPTQPPQQNGGV